MAPPRSDNDAYRTRNASQPAHLLCFSHLRWNFVFQRPQHLMSRFARTGPVTVWEDPIFAADQPEPARLDVRTCPESGVVVAVPHLRLDMGHDVDARLTRELLDAYVATLSAPIRRWFYTPMMLPLARHLDAEATVYDCMDELSAFKFAPPELVALEAELLELADVVFTGGYSIWEAKKDRHPNIHPFPSSVDVAHFAQARGPSNGSVAEPADQAPIARPRLGFYGVIDERIDLDLLAQVADARPEWQLVMLGPVAKIDEADLPRRSNIHYLGSKTYAELPAYLGGWDVALMPFAINDATRFISPTKTPEYLAGGRPVVSTPVRDVVRQYGGMDAVGIADTPEAFVTACEKALALRRNPRWLEPVDAALSSLSWDITQARMAKLIEEAAAPKSASAPALVQLGRKPHYDTLIVGAGFAGSVLAERLAADAGQRVLVIDKRPHIAGNAYDLENEAGVLYHQYGPHIFHTNSEEVFTYLSRFTAWRPYEHRVLGVVRDKLVPIPINRTTVNELYGLDLKTEDEVEAFFAQRAEPADPVRTSEDVVVGRVGRELYELFFRGYTRKQWALDPSELDKSVTARVPTRANTDDRYFTDTFQAMPRDGYTAMFANMLDQDGITVELGVEFEEIRNKVTYDHLIWTGPVDEYFGHRFGKLPYRSLNFRHETLDQEVFLPTGTVNYPAEDVPYTRISEYKYMTGQAHPKTTVTYEYPAAEGDPYYPIPKPENAALYKRYEALADREPNVTFVGRLATYRYYNMDQVVGQALATYRKQFAPEMTKALKAKVA